MTPSYAFHTANPAKPEELEAMTHKVLDSLEDAVMESRKIMGAGRNTLHMMEYALDTDDLEALRENLSSISGLPAVVPFPRWLNSLNSDYAYFWNGDDGKINLTAARTELTGVPDGCVMTAEGVSIEEAKSWVTELEAHGLPAPKSFDEGQKFTAVFEAGESRFAVVHEGNTASLYMTKNPVCLMPALYLKLRPSTTD